MRTRSSRVVLHAALTAVLVITAACSGQESAPPTAFESFTKPAQSGWGADEAATALTYRPNPDGLSFPNYSPTETFGVDDAIALFGDDAVCDTTSGDCVPTPEAQAWIDKVAAAAQAGVCEGMVLLSLDRYMAQAQPSTSQLGTDTEVNDRVVRLFATQFLPDVLSAAASARGTELAEVVARIEASLIPGAVPVTLGLYSAEGGHSLLPYALDRVTPERAAVYVYDPNWPGMDRFVEFDLAAGSWRYSFSSPDPAADPAPWLGTRNELDLVALDVRESPFAEPFAGATGEGQTLLTVTVTGEEWSVSTPDGEITPRNALPATEGVVGVIRDRQDATTIILEVSDGVVIDSSSPLEISVENDMGTVRGSSDGAGRYTVVDGATLGLRQDVGEGTLTAFNRRGVVRATTAQGSQLGIVDPATTRYGSPSAEVRLVTWEGSTRQDYELSVTGERTELQPPRYDESVRTESSEPTLQASLEEGLSPTTTQAPSTSGTTSTSTTPSSSTGAPSSSVQVPPSTNPGTQPPTTVPSATTTTTTTTTTVPPLAPVSVVVNPLTNGAVTITVTASNTAPFYVMVAGPYLSDVTGPQTYFNKTYYQLQPGAEYTIKVSMAGYADVVRNFKGPY